MGRRPSVNQAGLQRVRMTERGWLSGSACRLCRLCSLECIGLVVVVVLVSVSGVFVVVPECRVSIECAGGVCRACTVPAHTAGPAQYQTNLAGFLCLCGCLLFTFLFLT